MTESGLLHLRVVEARLLNPLLRLLRLRAADDAALPGWTAGAHLQLHLPLPAGEACRAYSLIDLPGLNAADGGAVASPREYLVAVRREDGGRGGSRWLHETLAAGDRLAAEPPRNDFPLAAEAPRLLLLAGGIGITPLAAMAAQCRRDGRPLQLHYAGRSRSQMALLPELQALLGDDLVVHADDEAGGRPPALDALLAACGDDAVLQVCGPQPLLAAVRAATEARGWAPGRLRFELFAPPPPAADGDQPFEVLLAQSGRRLEVGAGQTLLQALIDAGCDPVYDCQRGECGVCAVPVIEGEIEHRDFVLTAREREAGNVIQTCVSRCKGQRLVLDL